MSTQEEKLKAIADAIREKDGSAEPIPANDFPARIRAISSVPDGLHAITLAADPPEGGTVLGGGMASDGMMVTVRAEVADGYSSSGWQENGESISEDPEYTFPVQGDRELVAVFAAKPTSRLPEGYTEVEYIQTDTKCGIDTGIKPKQASTRFEMLLQVVEYSGNSSERLYSTPGNLSLALEVRSGNSLSYTYFRNTVSSISQSIIGEKVTVGFDGPNHRIQIGENIIDESAGTSVMTSPIYIGSAWDKYYSAKFKLFSCKIYDHEELLRDFVPCKTQDGKAGLYDLVNGVYYQNSWSGTLTPGPAV